VEQAAAAAHAMQDEADRLRQVVHMFRLDEVTPSAQEIGIVERRHQARSLLPGSGAQKLLVGV